MARFLAFKYQSHVKAHHVNSIAPAEPTKELHPKLFEKAQDTPLTLSEQAGLQRTMKFNAEGNGYMRQQATKPTTTGYFMQDSPIGLLAWLYEKLHDWSDQDSYSWTDDEVLTWVSIYYFSRPGAAAANYIYYGLEHRDTPVLVAAQNWSEVPLGISRFPKDLILLPKLWNQTMGPVVFEREHTRGGHFAAWECPKELVDDLRVMFGRNGGAFGAVGGKNGFDDSLDYT